MSAAATNLLSRPDAIQTRPASNQATMVFSVDVVDGNGLPVAYQPVSVRYRYRNTPPFEIVVPADADGRARFMDQHPELPLDLTLVSGGELIGPHPPRAALYTIEM